MQCMLDTDHCVYLIRRSPLITPQTTMNDCFISAFAADHDHNPDANERLF